jgi:hypothetical protein
MFRVLSAALRKGRAVGMPTAIGIITGGLLAIGFAVPAAADSLDIQYYRLLSDDGIIIWDYNLMKQQALIACRQQDYGASGLDAIHNLMPPYDFDMANSIVAAADVIYCPWHLSVNKGDNY